MHSALAEKLPPGRSTKEDLPTAVVLAMFVEQLTVDFDDPHFMGGDSTDSLRACGESLVRTYINQAAPSMMLRSCTSVGEIGGVPTRRAKDLQLTIKQIKVEPTPPSPRGEQSFQG